MAGTIVVGVDGSDASVVALRWATVEASLRNAEVHAVYAWTFPYVGELTGMSMAMVDRDELEADAKSIVAGIVQRVQAEQDGVTIREYVAEGSPASVLTEAAKGADLLVVGSRGRGGFTGLLLGSVSQQVAQHAPCPVVIIPHTEEAQRAVEEAAP